MTTRTELLEALALGEFGQINGAEEGPQIEFKEQAYSLATRKGRRDLIADVASLANGRGGLIVLGIREKRDSTSQKSLACEVLGVEKAAVDDDAYDKLLRAHIHPLVQDIEVRHYDGRYDGESCHLVAIIVEGQAEHDKPFIVDRIADFEEDRDLPHAVGWPTRSGDDTHWEHAARIQQLISNGLRGAQASTSSDGGEDIETEARAQIEFVENEEGWESWALYTLQVVPLEALPIDDFFGAFADTARQWSNIRADGFGLPLRWHPPEPMGNRLVSRTSRNAVLVGRKGVVTTAAIGSSEFLGWAQHTGWGSAQGGVIINPYALVEFTTESLRFAFEGVWPHNGATAWAARINATHLLDRAPLFLRETIGPAPPFPTEIHKARVSDIRVEISVEGEATIDAVSVLSEFYGQGFGLGRDNIPFVTDGRVDFAKFRL